MRKQILYLSFFAIVALMAVSCQKKVSLDKMREIVSQSVIAEEKDSGRTLVVDTILLQPKGNDYEGTIKGKLNDTIDVVYNLKVTDNGEDFDAEWERAD